MAFNFIDKFLEVTKLVESPTSYLRWASYITLSSVMRHNVYISMPSRRTKITPNLYVLLLGDSGATRKSTPLKITNFLLKRVNNTKLIEGRASIQGALKELAGVKRVDKQIIKFASGLLYSEEFSAFFVRDPSAHAILTDMYDYKEETEVILKTEETLKLEKVCVNLLAATNAAFLQDMFTKTDLYGGLCARIIFIVEEKARHKDLGLRDTSSEENWEELLHHLRYLAKLEGEAKFSDEAIEFLENWYSNTDFSLYESRTGFEHRAHTHTFKLAMILASAEEGFNLQIDKRHCEAAVDIVSDLRKNYHKLVATVGFNQNDIRQAIRDITVLLFQNIGRPLAKEDILRMLFGRIDSETFDKAIITLEHTKFISMTGTNIPRWELSEKGREVILGEITTSEVN